MLRVVLVVFLLSLPLSPRHTDNTRILFFNLMSTIRTSIFKRHKEEVLSFVKKKKLLIKSFYKLTVPTWKIQASSIS